MNFLQKWIGRWTSQNRRKAERHPAPELAVFYWTGGPPQARDVRDISSTGLYLLTEERWYPGTLVLMTLQKKDGSYENAERAISVQSMAVRLGSDGVGLTFVVPKTKNPHPEKNQFEEGVDEKALEKFLRQLKDQQGPTAS